VGVSLGYFITFEGIEGVGKTTCVKWLVEYLQKKSLNVVSSREPGGTEVAEAIRHILLQHYQESILPETELLLLFAGRAQHIFHKIKPALAQGAWVICDRFTDASFAYQGGGRGISFERVSVLEEWVQGDLRPDITFLLDAPLEITKARISKRKDLDRIESEQLEFFARVRKSYLLRAQQFPERYVVIDVSVAFDKVCGQIQNVIDKLLVRSSPVVP
jgi:dTMP kinase